MSQRVSTTCAFVKVYVNYYLQLGIEIKTALIYCGQNKYEIAVGILTSIVLTSTVRWDSNVIG